MQSRRLLLVVTPPWKQPGPVASGRELLAGSVWLVASGLYSEQRLVPLAVWLACSF